MESRTLYVSSENRNKTVYPHGNSYSIFLQSEIKNVVQVELVHATVPNTIFNLTNGTRVLSFSNTNIEQVGLSDLTTFSLHSGFYGAIDLASAITNAIGNTTGITTTYLASEGKFLFARDVIHGPFSMYSNTAEMSGLLGFSAANTNTVLNSSNIAYTSDLDVPLGSDNHIYRDKEFIVSDTLVNLAPNESLFLDIEELRNELNNDSMPRSFCPIPMDVSSGSVKIFKKATDFDVTVDYPGVISKLARLTIRWLDRLGQVVNFNGMDDHSFILKINTAGDAELGR